MGRKLKVRETPLERCENLNNRDWPERYIFLGAKPTAMASVFRDIQADNPFGTLWKEIALHFIGVETADDVFNLRSKEFDHAIAKNFSAGAMHQIYKFLAKGNSRHGLPYASRDQWDTHSQHSGGPRDRRQQRGARNTRGRWNPQPVRDLWVPNYGRSTFDHWLAQYGQYVIQDARQRR